MKFHSLGPVELFTCVFCGRISGSSQKTLACLHPICLDCARKNFSDEHNIDCAGPLCGGKTSVNKVEDLENHHYVLNVLKSVEEEQVDSNPVPLFPCMQCGKQLHSFELLAWDSSSSGSGGDQNDCSYWSNSTCLACIPIHLERNPEHQLMLCFAGGPNPLRHAGGVSCAKHPTKTLTVFCEKLKKGICVDCEMTHVKGHTHVPACQLRERIDTKRLYDVFEARDSFLRSMKNDLNTEKENSLKTVNTLIARLKQFIDAEGVRMAREINQAFDIKQSQLDELIQSQTEYMLNMSRMSHELISTVVGVSRDAELLGYSSRISTLENHLHESLAVLEDEIAPNLHTRPTVVLDKRAVRNTTEINIGSVAECPTPLLKVIFATVEPDSSQQPLGRLIKLYCFDEQLSIQLSECIQSIKASVVSSSGERRLVQLAQSVNQSTGLAELVGPVSLKPDRYDLEVLLDGHQLPNCPTSITVQHPTAPSKERADPFESFDGECLDESFHSLTVTSPPAAAAAGPDGLLASPGAQNGGGGGHAISTPSARRVRPREPRVANGETDAFRNFRHPTYHGFLNEDGSPRKIQTKLVLALGSGRTGAQPGCFKFPIGSGVTRSEEIVVCDHGNDRVQLFDLNGNLQFTIPDIQRPSAVSCSSNGVIAVRGDHGIFFFDGNGHPMRDRHVTLKRPYGLAPFKDDQLVTLDLAKKNEAFLTVLDWDGRIRNRSRYQPLLDNNPDLEKSKCRFLDVFEDTVYVSDLGASKIYVTSIDGRMENHFGEFGNEKHQMCEPAGIKRVHNTLLLADSKNNRLKVYDLEGNTRSILGFPRNENIRRPADFCFGPRNTLVINSFLGHQVLLYQLLE